MKAFFWGPLLFLGLGLVLWVISAIFILVRNKSKERETKLSDLSEAQIQIQPVFIDAVTNNELGIVTRHMSPAPAKEEAQATSSVNSTKNISK